MEAGASERESPMTFAVKKRETPMKYAIRSRNIRRKMRFDRSQRRGVAAAEPYRKILAGQRLFVSGRFVNRVFCYGFDRNRITSANDIGQEPKKGFKLLM